MQAPTTLSRTVLVIAVVAVAYYISGRLGLLLAIPPGYATAVWPASGIALAAVLVCGWRVLPGVWLGSFMVNVRTGLDTTSLMALLHSMVAPSAIAMGATLQALAGAWLVRRFVGLGNILSQEVDVIRMLVLGGPVACLMAATVGTGALWLNGAIPDDTVLFNWWTWWVGDAIGVFVFTPAVLIWTVRPYRLWLRQQLSVTVPLILMFCMVVAVFINTSSREQARLERDFASRADQLTQNFRSDLDRYRVALSSIAGLFISSKEVTRSEFDRFAGLILGELPELRAMSWNPLISEGERDAFEAEMRREGLEGYRIMEMDSAGQLVPVAPRRSYVPVAFIKHNGSADVVTGFDVASSPTRRQALDIAARSGQLTATGLIDLVGDSQNASGILLLLPVFKPDSARELMGYATLVVRVNDLMAGLIKGVPLNGLELGLVDRSAGGAPQLLAETTPGQQLGHGDLSIREPLRIAQRDWELRYTLPASYLVANRSWQAWLVLAAGLMLTALLGMLLLVIVGRSAKIGLLVEQRTAELNRTLSLLAATLESTADGILVVDSAGKVASFNRKFTEMWQIPEALRNTVEDGRLLDAVLPQLEDPDEFLRKVKALYADPTLESSDLLQFRDGKVFERYSRPQFIGGEIVGRVWSFRDITERKQAELRILELAHHDALTQLPNRTLLMDRLEQAIEHARRDEKLVAVLMLDLDHFKNINDSLGHQIGDQLLRTVAQRLNGCVRRADTVARMGGDEFVVVLGNVADRASTERIATAMMEQVSLPITIGEHELIVTPSIGICLFPHDGVDASHLLKHADTAMYQAKARGRSNYQWFNPGMLLAAEERLELEGALRRALERNEFSLHYQPLMSIRSGRVVGMEALLRWQHPRRGTVRPASFIMLAEETGLINPIGEWALRRACFEGRILQDQLGIPLVISVNISTRQFRHEGLVQVVKDALQESGLPPRTLLLEITESVLAANPQETVAILTRIRELGVRIAVDDFGTGYSSLSYITRFPIDMLKVDRSFVRDIIEDKSDAAITGAIIAMAHSLNIEVIAEGVETPEQLAFLKERQCDEAQGFHFSPPVPLDQFVSLVETLNHEAGTPQSSAGALH